MKKFNMLVSILILLIIPSSKDAKEIIGKICNPLNFCGEINTKELFIKDASGTEYKLEKINEKNYKVIGGGTLQIINDKKLKWSEYGELDIK